MRHLVLYDGECGLCSRSVQFVLNRDPAGIFGFAPLQSARAQEIARRHGINIAMDTFYLVENFGAEQERLLSRSEAALTVSKCLNFPWRLGGGFLAVPKWMRDGIYDFIANHRHEFFRSPQECLVPTPEQRARFLT